MSGLFDMTILLFFALQFEYREQFFLSAPADHFVHKMCLNICRFTIDILIIFRSVIDAHYTEFVYH